MSLPFCKTRVFRATSGQFNAVELPGPFRGAITRLVVSQRDGSLEGFTYNVYDRADACENTAENSANPSDDMERFASVMHQVLATQTVTATNATSSLFDVHHVYRNRDEQDPILRMPKRMLYLDIQPSGSGEKEFQVSYTIEQPELF